MNKKKIKKYFKILFVPISMFICLSLFLVNSFANEGFNYDSNGNIDSLNIANLDTLSNVLVSDEYDFNVNNQTLILTNSVSNSTDPYIYFDDFITLQPYTTYSFYVVINNQFEVCGLTYDNSGNFYYGLTTSKQTITTGNDNLIFGFGFEGLVGLDYEIKIMIYEGSDNLDYFPYGDYYSTPQDSNFMEYLIGENYFSSGRAMVYQTNTESPYWDRQIYPSNRSCYYQIGNTSIGDYIIGKTLYLQNLSSALISGLQQDSSYVYARNTTLSLKPSFNFSNSSITYLNIPCKFLNLDIYCPNGVFECSCYVGSGLELGSTEGNERVYFQQSGDYIHIDFDDNDNRWMFEIEIVLNHSNNTFISPSNIVSNTNDTLQWDLYQIGYDDGFRGQEAKIDYLQYQIDDLNSKITNKQNTIDILQQQNEQLRNSLQQNFGFDDVFFALADTPFKTASNMLGFELFGVNLFNALIGFITVLACIWLLKKFL